MSICRVLFILAATIAAVAPCRAQTLAGQVIGDSTRKPLANVRVLMIDVMSKSVVDSTTTDTGGVFYATAKRPGTYRIRFERAGLTARFSSPQTLDAGGFVQALFPLSEGTLALAYVDGDIDKPAQPDPGNRAPRYPVKLRQAGVNGAALVSFVIDTTGHAVARTLRIIGATKPEFGDAAQTALMAMRFFPAKREGQSVDQWICMPFTFEVDFGRSAVDLNKQLDLWRAQGCPH